MWERRLIDKEMNGKVRVYISICLSVSVFKEGLYEREKLIFWVK